MNNQNNHEEKLQLIIVIVNYFSADDSYKLIEHVLQQKLPDLSRIICIDNSCNVKESQALQKCLQLEKVEIQFNDDNIGFGAAINKATKNKEFNNLLLINPDVDLSDNAIQELLNVQKEHISGDSIDDIHEGNTSGIWGGLTVTKDGSPDFFHAWRKPSLLRELAWACGVSSISKSSMLVNHYKYTDYSSNYPVDIVSGCFLLISGKLWRDLKGFDERYFLYSEEADLCIRAKTDHGVQPEVVVNATLEHERGATLNNNATRLFYMFSSKILFWEKHTFFVKALLVKCIYILGSFFRGVIFVFLPQKKQFAKDWICLSFLLLRGKRVK